MNSFTQLIQHVKNADWSGANQVFSEIMQQKTADRIEVEKQTVFKEDAESGSNGNVTEGMWSGYGIIATEHGKTVAQHHNIGRRSLERDVERLQRQFRRATLTIKDKHGRGKAVKVLKPGERFRVRDVKEDVEHIEEASEAAQKHHAEIVYKALSGQPQGPALSRVYFKHALPAAVVDTAVEKFVRGVRPDGKLEKYGTAYHTPAEWKNAGRLLQKATKLGIKWNRKYFDRMKGRH